MTLPQLRVRTEYTFGRAFGPLARVAARLKDLQAPAAGIVDPGTWGHVRWADELSKAGMRPLFGVELAVPQADGRRPVAWALATDTRGFYQFSTAARRPEADVAALFAAAGDHSVRFCGAALTDPACFDYVDLNPGSPLAARRAYELHRRTRRPLVITSDNSYPAPADRAAYIAHADFQQITPQHLLAQDELRQALDWLSEPEFKRAVRNTQLAAERCASTLATAPIISFEGDLKRRALDGAKERLQAGHIAAWTTDYQARLERELAMIEEKKFASYFLVVEDLVRWAKTRMLVGPARGSSAGSLVCYLLRITEVDPLRHGLLFERFIDVTRSDLPDIDIDFSDRHRDEVFVYLAQKYGADKVARIGNINTMKPRTVMGRLCARLGIPEHEKFDVLNVLIEHADGDARYGKSLEDTFATTEPGRRFAARHPESRIMCELENHASHTGVHAAGVVVCNEPVSAFCTVGPDGIAQIDKPDAEKLNLLKIDALGLRTLGIIEDAGVVTADELYALTLDDPEVFRIFNDHRYEGIFQFEGQAQREVAREMHIHSFKQLDHCTALARPGPMGAGATRHYIQRAAGRETVTYAHPSMAATLADTFGVVIYQEQVMRLCAQVGGLDWPQVSAIRKAISRSKGKETVDRLGQGFVDGAEKNGVPRAAAQEIWDQIATFGGYGMNASHTVSYAIISYWCAWMKRYHPLEFAAASMRGAKDDEHALKLLRDIVAEGVDYTLFDIERSREHWSAVDGRLLGGFQNLVDVGPAKAAAYVQARDAGKLTEKQRAKLQTMHCKFRDLFPLRSNYAGLYADPEAHGCAAGSVVLTADRFPAGGDVLWLCRVLKKSLRDENEPLRVGRREGRRMTGQTLFVDLHCTDDTGTPVIVRIDRRDYEPRGRQAMENLKPDDVLLVRGRRVPDFAMIKVLRIKCLTNPEALP